MSGPTGAKMMIAALREPARLRQLGPDEWEQLLEQADESRLQGRLVEEADRLGLDRDAPHWIRDRLAGARALGRDSERALAWEIGRLGRAFLEYPHRWVLLKGAAYVAAGLPPARGRRTADIDVLVPATGLAQAEAALKEHGWEPQPLSEYDERYYREWMHEIPPLVHQTRRSVIDLHHAILPRTSRLKPDPGRLLAQAAPSGSAHVLSPPHMVIHGAVHLFHDGEIGGAVRDLVDLDGLFRHFNAEVDFWSQLIDEANVLDVGRPVYYALRYSARLLGTPVPAPVLEAARAWAPPAPVRRLMDGLVERTLSGPAGARSKSAAFGLYLRSHWLRMPPGLLARHLAHKLVAR